MSDSSRKASNGAVEQIMRNMTSDIQNSDGQYIQLGFTPPSTPQEHWNMPNQLPQTSYIPSYNLHNQDLSFPMEQYPQPPVNMNYLQQQQMYNQDLFDKHGPTEMSYPYTNHEVMFSPDYKLFMSQKRQNMSEHNFQKENMRVSNNSPSHIYLQHQDNVILNNQASTNPTQLIDNLVGNWVPNTSGTYSPFGNVNTFNSSYIFEQSQDMDILTNNIVQPSKSVEYNRDIKKPVAEVKPMRPTYSDVLLKSAPQSNIKMSKLETKETKLKKDTKKNVKSDKPKLNSTLNRSNTSNEIKDITNEKTLFNKSTDKNIKDGKSSNLTRKWASLDNVTDSSNDFKAELSEGKKTKRAQENGNKTTSKVNQRKNIFKNDADTDSGSGKADSVNTSKSTARKGVKVGNKQKSYDNGFGSGERPPSKRVQRSRKRDNQVSFGLYGQKLTEYLGWWKYIAKFFVWLFNLVSDILSLSIHLGKDAAGNSYSWLLIHWALFLDTSMAIIKRIRIFTWIYEKFKKEKEPEKKPGFMHRGLHNNINMPTTGEDAMKRLLACKGKDPYSILGVIPTCTDGDIKNYYKKQAKLVHPDKNQQPGAEEAFKILVHAFDMIGEPERRAAYDRGVAESAQAEQAMSELTELLVQLQQKVEAAANTIRCSACGLRHKRIKIDRPSYAARNCVTCKIRHAAREGDIWAEARCLGILWYYYACMDGGVYDITEWAGCQKESLKHLRPDSHNVQYRIALGKQTNGPPKKHMSAPRMDRTPDLDHLFNSFYGQPDSTQNMRRKTKKAK